jgi:hypothetical protein
MKRRISISSQKRSNREQSYPPVHNNQQNKTKQSRHRSLNNGVQGTAHQSERTMIPEQWEMGQGPLTARLTSVQQFPGLQQEGGVEVEPS